MTRKHQRLRVRARSEFGVKIHLLWMMFSPSPTTVTNWPLGEWSKYVANISVELIFLVERETSAICERDGWEGRGVGDSLKVYVVVASID
jgi:hypothetical protein